MGRVWDDVEEVEEAGKAGRPLGEAAELVLGGWGMAEVIPSILPACSGAVIEPSSACSPAARVEDWRARLRPFS